MNNELEISFQQTYIHVRVTGAGTRERIMEVWRRVAAMCRQHNCYKILGEQDLQVGISTLDALDHPDIFREVGITEKFRIAWVELNPRTFETTDFIRNVLANRAMGQGKIFTRVEDARQWLLRK